MWSDIYLTAVLAGLGTWFVVTCLSAIPFTQRVLGRVLGRSELLAKFVPTWSFFAPNPGSHDFRLLCRDELVDGTIAPWREVHIYSDRRPATAAVWNPGQRRKKALFDVAQELSAGASAWDRDPELVKLSVAYLLLLTYVSSVSRSVLSCRRQFVLVSTSRRDSPRVLFVSAMHDLDADQGNSVVNGTGALV